VQIRLYNMCIFNSPFSLEFCDDDDDEHNEKTKGKWFQSFKESTLVIPWVVANKEIEREDFYYLSPKENNKSPYQKYICICHNSKKSYCAKHSSHHFSLINVRNLIAWVWTKEIAFCFSQLSFVVLSLSLHWMWIVNLQPL